MEILGYVVMTALGLVLGSFGGAQVWRLRAWQLIEDKASGEEYSKRELKNLVPLTKRSLKNDRSQCLHCHHDLAWYDLLPVLSWLSTGGKCRYCKKAIGVFEPLIEVGMAALFVAFYHYWTLTYDLSTTWPLFIVWIAILVMMMILLAYDAKWFLLPDRVMFPLIVLSVFVATWHITAAPDPLSILYSTIGAILILGGLYLMLWFISRGAWVGFGDVKLGLALGLLLGDWMLALLTLFLANFLGLLMVLPGLIGGKMTRKTHVPFGPMLIVGFFVALFYGYGLVEGYLQLTNSLITDMLML
jgi:prepilin signal peptidase PulO-like enzyme (type II secretory pathway)